MIAKNPNEIISQIDILNIAERRINPFQDANTAYFAFRSIEFESWKTRKIAKYINDKLDRIYIFTSKRQNSENSPLGCHSNPVVLDSWTSKNRFMDLFEPFWT